MKAGEVDKGQLGDETRAPDDAQSKGIIDNAKEGLGEIAGTIKSFLGMKNPTEEATKSIFSDVLSKITGVIVF